MKSKFIAVLLVTGAAAAGAALIPSLPAQSAPSFKLPDLVPFNGSFNDHYVDRINGRKLLRFSAGIVNRGNGPLEIRGKRSNRNAPMMGFQRLYLNGGGTRDSSVGTLDWVPQQQEWHVMFLAAYDLLDDDDRHVTDTNKFSHCVSDDSKKAPGGAARRKYKSCPGGVRTLSFKVGLSVSWADIYEARTVNQSLDITNVPPGHYTWRMTANPDGEIQETTRGNNVLTKGVNL